jgi:beta-lactamase superfamily II metal-dependent hydrolase
MALLEIFDVAHGQCSLLSSDGGAHLLIDCGHNGTTGWRPSDMLRRRGIRWLDELIITNCDEDHASDLPNVLDTATLAILTSNPTVSGRELYQLKASGGMGRGIAALAKMTVRCGGAPLSFPDYDGMTFRTFWNRYPFDFEDENNLSLVTVMRWPSRDGRFGFSILYAGDMERDGWLALLRRADFCAEMRDITVFVASHHGRLSGYCAELFEWTGLRPVIFVISDCGLQYATQDTIALYRQHARGVLHNGVNRRVITTRRDGYIRFTIEQGRAVLNTSH